MCCKFKGCNNPVKKNKYKDHMLCEEHVEYFENIKTKGSHNCGNYISSFVQRAKNRTKKKGLPECTIISEDIYSVWPTDGLCPFMRIPLTAAGDGKSGSAHVPELDRIDPALGYVPGNVRIISQAANRMKGEMSDDQFVDLLEYLGTQYQPTPSLDNQIRDALQVIKDNGERACELMGLPIPQNTD